jgi:transcriptional regulator with XRE-family HTH domain
MNIGKIIAELRDKKGMNQVDLADKSGVSRVMIGKYERGEAAPLIKKRCNALKTWNTWKTIRKRRSSILSILISAMPRPVKRMPINH